jgi:hypothetical protein
MTAKKVEPKKEKPALKRLPNGSWIYLDTVKSIRVHEPEPSIGLGWRVVVQGTTGIELLRFPEGEMAAKNFADSLAADVNAVT